MKSGAEHLRSLRDGRALYLGGERIDDHTEHRAFRNAVRTAAALYDWHCRDEQRERMTFISPTSGESVSRMWQLPGSCEELRQRRRALEGIARQTCGMLGRSPDHVASVLSGFYMALDLFERHHPARAAAVRDYFHHARDRDLYLSYAIVSPQADRSRGTSEQADPFLVCGVCDEDASGVTLKGAKMLATAIPLANEVLVAAIQPLKPGEERYSVSAVVPLNTPGLRLLSRKSYEASCHEVFDNPLAARFDENDCVLYFDEVRVPWERVFVHGDVRMAQDQWHAGPTHVYQNYQCQIRLLVKLQFLLGLAHRIAQVNGVLALAPVREQLGQLAAEVAMVEGLICGMESAGSAYRGYWVPNRAMLYSAQVLTQQLYPRFVGAIRELAGGGLIMVPASVQDLSSAATRDIVVRTQQSPVTDALGRVKLMKLAWDALGSEFASRHVQYEMFYAGAAMVTRAHAYRSCDWGQVCALVDEYMATYGPGTPGTESTGCP
ncbi:MAG TPA: 4-hydroxyphenylacetate 3-hydroxylase N-terminal domain-containing protein [Steroidobacteraceae bacterium]|nr:4-hydroxyphenylacetate 3-hydroxylase N-terminal domain-containing protein [Steroidobacteraceae bacterium]